MISHNTKDRINKEIPKYPEKRAALLPALHIVQDESGWISEGSMIDIATLLEIEPIEVMETVSFYTMFNTKPIGKYHLQVCTNLSCSLLDSRHIMNYLEERLEIKCGETTPDRKITLSHVECLGYCGTAPVMLINEEIYENLTEQKLEEVLSYLE